MRGRSAAQAAAREEVLHEMAEILASSPMTVRQIRDALSSEGLVLAPATVLARIAALADLGYEVVGRRRREKVPGKSGPRERVYSVVLP